MMTLLDVAWGELVSIVGGGGKTTLLFALGDEARRQGRRVLLTTTTKMGADQTGGHHVLVAPTPDEIRQALDDRRSVVVFGSRDVRRVTGMTPDGVDRVHALRWSDLVVVEADGSRRRPIKAPASYEPVVPRRTTTLVVVMGAEAIGRRISEVAHRPELVSAVLGVPVEATLTPASCGRLLAHPDGGRRGAPDDARVVGVVTKVDAHRATDAASVAREAIGGGLDRVVLLPDRDTALVPRVFSA